jgi:hypothetical protein
MAAQTDTKVCSGCGLPKDIDTGFYSSHRADGRIDVYGRCKECHNKHVARRRRDRIAFDPGYLQREADRVAAYRQIPANRRRANDRSNANHEALSRLKARYPQRYEELKDEELARGDGKRSVALYRAARTLRDEHMDEYQGMYQEALLRKGVT